MLKPWLIHMETVFKLAFQSFLFVFTLVEMAIFGRKNIENNRSICCERKNCHNMHSAEHVS